MQLDREADNAMILSVAMDDDFCGTDSSLPLAGRGIPAAIAAPTHLTYGEAPDEL
jgi:hypothetical protein